MNKEEIEELKDFTIDLTDIDELALGLEVCSKKSNMVIQEFADTIIQLQQENQQQNQLLKDKGFIIDKLMEENKQLREKVNKFNIDKINNENKSLKGSCKVLGEKNNNQRKELQRLNNKIEKLKAINEQHRKINGKLREENQKYKEVIDKAIKYIEKCLKQTPTENRTKTDDTLDIEYEYILGILKEVE